MAKFNFMADCEYFPYIILQIIALSSDDVAQMVTEKI
jgi:hypothetical protein